jgi:hypothetical protein
MEKKYLCICGKKAINYENHIIVGNIQALMFSCEACGFGSDRSFVFPPEDADKVLYLNCLNLFNSLGKDFGFSVDLKEFIIKDEFYLIRIAAELLLERLATAELDGSLILEELIRLGVYHVPDGEKDPT